jgi:hypothetical protein
MNDRRITENRINVGTANEEEIKDYYDKQLNKKQVEDKFKNSKSIKKTINDYKSIDEQRQQIKEDMKKQNIPESEFSEDEKSFHVGNVGIFKNEKDKVSYVDKLPYDVKGKNIKEYGNNYVKTDYAIYELDYSSNIPTDKDNPNSTADYFLGNDPEKTDYYKQQAKMNR